MSEDEFGQKMNGMPKVVVSTTLTDPEWANTTVITGDLEHEIPALKERYDGDVLVAGSAQLAQSLLALGLVDEIRLMVFPVLLGEGKKLFADDGPMTAFTLAETGQTGDCVTLVLRRS
jgi:dihydrofolate reductase